MRRKLNWLKRLPKDLIWEIREHALLAISVGKEDPMWCLEHSLKDADMETLVHPSEEEDEMLEAVAAADGAVGVKADL